MNKKPGRPAEKEIAIRFRPDITYQMPPESLHWSEKEFKIALDRIRRRLYRPVENILCDRFDVRAGCFVFWKGPHAQRWIPISAVEDAWEVNRG